MNCQTHLEAKATFPLAHDGAQFSHDRSGTGTRRRGRGAHAHGLYGGTPRRAAAAALALEATEKDAPFRVEIR